MMVDAILAVALGIVPVDGPAAVKVHVSPTQMVKGYTRRIDSSGKVHVGGIHPQTGQRYNITITSAGQVKGWVGQRHIRFQASPAS